MSWKDTLLCFLSMRHHKSITHLDILENDGPLFQITHIDSLKPRGGVPSHDIGRTDRHLCSIALFGESLDGLKGLHSLNERELLLTDGCDCTRCQNLNSMGESVIRCAVRAHRHAAVVSHGIGRLGRLDSPSRRVLWSLGHCQPDAEGASQNACSEYCDQDFEITFHNTPPLRPNRHCGVAT